MLLALGFGALNVAALSGLSTSSPRSRPVDPDSLLRPAAAAEPAEPAVPVDPPAIDGAAAEPAASHTYDVVITGGRVMDPESGYDAMASIGIDGERVTAISTDALTGRRTIDATDKVVAPGFIDILSYEPNDYGIWYKIADGVTTNLGMHGINARAADFFERFAGEGSPCHYGGAYDNPFARDRLRIGVEVAATASQLDELVADAAQQLADGWIGLDFEPEYTPGIETGEMARLAEVGAEVGAASYFHGRFSTDVEPGTNADTLAEILAVARQSGAGVHVQHIISTGGTFTMARSLATLQAAVDDEALDVTACMYPYNYWATTLASARFSAGWEERFHITYEDLQVPGTGQRLTEASFEELQRDNVLVAAYAIPDDDVATCLRSPLVMLGSDAILEPGDNNHPRSTGCFTRLLGRYVRDRGVLDLMTALEKMTIMPARRVEAAAPAMARKGRLQRGADADVVVFDPRTVTDTSTVDDPAQFSTGMDHVLVLGQVVQGPDGRQDQTVRPGRPITATSA